jgi:hypothetical protein
LASPLDKPGQKIAKIGDGLGHPRLSAVDVSNGDGGPLVVEIVRFSRDEPGEG